jgi:hypothetical protein
MSTNLNHEDLWNDLYSYLCSKTSKATGETIYDHVTAIMEEMDPRLTEDEKEESL